MQPEISVVIPAHNEGARLAATVEGIAIARAQKVPTEFVIVDDGSTDDCATRLGSFASHQVNDAHIRIRIYRVPQRIGVPRARNLGAAHAAGNILVMTDAHVQFQPGWDEIVFRHLAPNRVLAATIRQENTTFYGYGCRLAVPQMGTFWNKEPLRHIAPVQIAACSGTAISRDLFMRLGGYDSAMLFYGGAEPEFSVRAWLEGGEVLSVPEFVVQHRFKPQQERDQFVSDLRSYMLHNSLRFGLLYLSELGSLQLLRYFAQEFPEYAQDSLRMVAASDVWERRAVLERRRRKPFSWFVKRFGITDEAGRELL